MTVTETRKPSRLALIWQSDSKRRSSLSCSISDFHREIIPSALKLPGFDLVELCLRDIPARGVIQELLIVISCLKQCVQVGSSVG